MKLSPSFKIITVEVICYLYILLFVYAAVSKLIDYRNFEAQLGQSPLLSAYAVWVAPAVIFIEILISLLLAINKFRTLALWASFLLMVMFCTYIVIIMNYTSFIPCSCGGILENMGWGEHLVFNLVFVLLSIAGIFLTGRITNIRIMSTAFAGIIAVTLLYLTSEDIMQKRNPFIRRFIQGLAYKEGEINLNNYSFYFAGTSGSRIYLGNSKAPLHLVSLSSDLKNTQFHQIAISKDDYPFKNVRVAIKEPNFFLVDGTVPVIFKGKVSDWKASAILDKEYYFSKFILQDSINAVFRAQSLESKVNILGSFHFGKTVQGKLHTGLLSKQLDGVFDTDGVLCYSAENNSVGYLYFYRNEYLIADDSMNNITKGKTIDSTSRARLKITKVGGGESKMAAPPYLVNKNAAMGGKYLFVNAGLKGFYEPEDIWDKASIIDVYDYMDKKYLASFYVYDNGKWKASEFYFWDGSLYVITGNVLQKYLLNDKILK